jgi:SAM-dependent methyltransferase
MEIDPTFYQVGLDQDFYHAQPYNTPAILDFGRSVNLEIDRLLDIGCGDGQLLRFLKSRKENVEYFGLTGPGSLSNFPTTDLKILEGDMHSLPWPDNFFDTVTARHVLEHSIAPTLALREIRRVLKPGGSLYAVMPDSSSEWIAEWDDHYSVLTPHNWKKLFSDNGLELVNYKESTWLASHSMMNEIEYRFIVKKSENQPKKNFGSFDFSKVSVEDKPDTAKIDFKMIVVLHNLMLFSTIVSLISRYKDFCLVLIPDFVDQNWNDMAMNTKSSLDSMGWNTRLISEVNVPLECHILLAPYAYSEIIPVNAQWRGRFVYGLAKDDWNFSFKNNLPFDFVMTLGPFDDSVISSMTHTVQVGSMKTLSTNPKVDKPGKPVLLYLPTHGPNSNLQSIKDLVDKLKVDYKVFVKPHHGNFFLDKSDLESFEDPDVTVIDYALSTFDAICDSDVVLADVSGVVAEAISVGKPVVVLDTKQAADRDVVLDFLLTGGCIIRATSIEQVFEMIPKALELRTQSLESAGKKLFWAIGNEASNRAQEFIDTLLNGSDDHTISKLLNRREVRKELLRLSSEINKSESLVSRLETASKEQLNQVLRDYHESKEQLNQVLRDYHESKEKVYSLDFSLRNAMTELENLNEMAANYSEEISCLASDIFEIKESSLVLREENLRLSKELATIYKSQTYRIFKPYRFIMKFIKH